MTDRPTWLVWRAGCPDPSWPSPPIHHDDPAKDRYYAVVALALAITLPAHAEDALPDPTMTPGAVDPLVTLSDICNGTTKERRPRTTAACQRAFAAYSIPPADRGLYECDHLVPVAIGGSSALTNLWPQPMDEAHRKDRLEVELQRRACVAFRTLVPAEAAAVLAQEQREVADDWVAAERRYMR